MAAYKQNKSRITGQPPVNSEKKKKKLRFPNTFLIIAGLMLLFIFVSWILHWSGVTYKLWVPPSTDSSDGHFKTLNIAGLGILDVFVAIWTGFQSKVEIIIFVFALGGILFTLERFKVLDAGIGALVNKMKGKEIILIPALMLVFGLGGTTYGMWEETLAFFPVIIPIFIKAKYDGITGVFVVLLGAGTGCLASTINPFATTVAFDGATGAIHAIGGKTIYGIGPHIGLFWLIWIIFMIPAIAFVMWYAIRVKKTKGATSALSVENDMEIKNKFVTSTVSPEFTIRIKISLWLFLSAFLVLILAYLPWNTIVGTAGVVKFNSFMSKYFYWLASSSANANGGIWTQWGSWYFIPVAALFLLVTVVIAFVNRHEYKNEIPTDNGAKHTEERFIATYFYGVSSMLPVCILIATAAGLGVILQVSGIGPLIANSASSVKNIGFIGFGIVIFFICMILSILIPSSSGFAAAFIPIIAQAAYKAFPGSDGDAVAAVTLVVICFVLSNGLANFFTPTSASLMAYTAFSKIEYKTWIKATWKFTTIMFVVAIIVVVVSAEILPLIKF